MGPTPDLSEAPRPSSATLSISSNLYPASQAPSERSRRASDEPPAKRPRADDGAICPICSERYATTGDHRPAVLKCGHLFGLRCIKRWLRYKHRTGSCPACRAHAKSQDIRNIYTDGVTPIDNSEFIAVNTQLTQLQAQREKELRITDCTLNSPETSLVEGSNLCGVRPDDVNVNSGTRRRNGRARRPPGEPSEPPTLESNELSNYQDLNK